MDQSPEHFQQHPPIEQVWSLPSDQLCDSLPRLLGESAISLLQKQNQNDLVMIVHALIDSGILSSICQEFCSQAKETFESSLLQFNPSDCLSNGLLHALSLLVNGQQAMATHALRSFRYEDPDSSKLFEIFLAKMLYEKLNIDNGGWDPSLLLLSDECRYYSAKGVVLALSVSPEAALSYYDDELRFDDEDNELRAQRAALHLLRGDLAAAEDDIQTLLKQGEIEDYIQLRLALNWLSQQAAVPTLY